VKPQQRAPLPGTEPKPPADGAAPDVPGNETEPEAPPVAAAAAPPVAAEPEPVVKEPAPQPPPDPRDAIVARRRELRNAEVEEGAKDPQVRLLDTFAGNPAGDTNARPTVNEPELPPADAPAAAAAAPAGPKVKITVYGEDVEVDETEVYQAGVATLQKERAAEYRLKQASDQENKLRSYHRDLDAYNDRLKKLEQDLRAGKAPNARDVSNVAALPSGASAAVDDAAVAEAARKAAEAIYKGDPAESAKALQSLLASVAQGREATPPPVDVKAVAEAAADVVEQRRDTRTKEEKRAAVNTTFSTEFPKVLEHPEAFAVAKARFDAMLADPDNSGKPWEQLAREAGQVALGRYPELKDPASRGNAPVNPAATVDDQLKARREVKARTVVRSASSTPRAPAPAAPQPRTNKQYIADMRAGRGLPAA
jgi:hypothetical protein